MSCLIQVVVLYHNAQPFIQQLDLDYRKVSSNEMAQLWSSVFSRAFGYMINGEILVKTSENIGYYITYYGNQPVGTAVLYMTGNIAGIHSIGVIPHLTGISNGQRPVPEIRI